MAKSNQELATKINGNGEVRAKTVADQVGDWLRLPGTQAQLMAALPKHMTADRMARIALTEIRKNPRLMSCTLPSLMAGIMEAAQLGIEIGILGQGYLVPYGNQAQFQIGYRGLIGLCRRSGDLLSIAAEVVCKNDRFVFKRGYDEKLEHEPCMFGDRGEVIGVYAYALTKDGGRYATVMTVADVEHIRAKSKAGQNGPWVTDWEEMAKKTAIKRLAKTLPLSIEVASQIEKDDEIEFDNATSIEVGNLGKLPAPVEHEVEFSENLPDVMPAAPASEDATA